MAASQPDDADVEEHTVHSVIDEPAPVETAKGLEDAGVATSTAAATPPVIPEGDSVWDGSVAAGEGGRAGAQVEPQEGAEGEGEFERRAFVPREDLMEVGGLRVSGGEFEETADHERQFQSEMNDIIVAMLQGRGSGMLKALRDPVLEDVDSQTDSERLSAWNGQGWSSKFKLWSHDDYRFTRIRSGLGSCMVEWSPWFEERARGDAKTRARSSLNFIRWRRGRTRAS